MAYYDNHGITLASSAELYSQGSPNNRNYLVYYGLVQEQPALFLDGEGPAESFPIMADPTNPPPPPAPIVFLRLTTICAPTGETNLLNFRNSGSGNEAVERADERRTAKSMALEQSGK